MHSSAKALLLQLKKENARAREKKTRRDFFVRAYDNIFMHARKLKNFSTRSLSVEMPEKKLVHIFASLGAKKWCSSDARNTFHAAARVHFFISRSLARAFGENNAEQRLVRGCHPGCVFSFMKSGHRWHFCDNNCHQPQNGTHSTPQPRLRMDHRLKGMTDGGNTMDAGTSSPWWLMLQVRTICAAASLV